METTSFATASRGGSESLLYAEACLKQGMSYQAAARAADVCVSDLMSFAPGYETTYRAPPQLEEPSALAKCASVLATASPSEIRRIAALAIGRVIDTSGAGAAREVFDNVAMAAISAPGKGTPRAQIMTMIEGVAARHGFTRAAIMGRSRYKPLVHARQEAYWTVYKNTSFSYLAVARVFGRDHTTITHGINAHEKRMGVQ